MSGANRKNPEPRHLAERYTLRRRVLSAKFTRAGDRHLAHAQEEDDGTQTQTPVGASGSSPGVAATTSAEGDLPIAPTDEPAASAEEAQL